MLDQIDNFIHELEENDGLHTTIGGEERELTHAEKVAETRQSARATKALVRLVRQQRTGRISEADSNRQIDIVIRDYGFFK